MGSIYKRGSIYWIAWTDHRGHQHAESTRQKGRPGTGRDRNAAKRLLQEREGDVVKGLPVTAATGKLPFSEALQDVVRDQQVNGRRAVDSTERRIRLHIDPFFTGRRIAEITTTQLRAYVADRKDAGAKPATINRELAVIRRAFRLSYRAGHILTMPHVALLDESRNVRQGIIEPHDFAKVLTALKPEAYAAAAEVAFITGWRLRSEVLTLTWKQIDIRARVIRIDVGMTKGGEGRTFPMTKRLRTIIKAAGRQEVKGCALVFHEEGGTAISPRRFYTGWRMACEVAGVAGLIPHDLRRSAVREMERRQIPRQVSMKLVGHKTESMFRRYAIVSETEILDAGSRLDQPVKRTTGAKSRVVRPRQ